MIIINDKERATKLTNDIAKALTNAQQTIKQPISTQQKITTLWATIVPYAQIYEKNTTELIKVTQTTRFEQITDKQTGKTLDHTRKELLKLGDFLNIMYRIMAPLLLESGQTLTKLNSHQQLTDELTQQINQQTSRYDQAHAR